LIFVVYSVMLNVMYTMVETIRWPNDDDSEEWKTLRDNFRAELSTGLQKISTSR